MKIDSLSEKLILYFVLLGIATIMAISTMIFVSTRKALLNRTFDQLTSLRYVKTNQVEQFYRDRIRDLSLLAATPEAGMIITSLEEDNMSLKEKMLTKFSSKYGSLGNHFTCFYILPASGKSIRGHFASSDPLPDDILTDSIISSIRLQLTTSTVVIGDQFFDQRNQRPCQFMATMIPADSENKADDSGSILIISVSIDAINEIMLNNDPYSGLGLSGETYLVGDDLLMRSTSRFLPASILRTKVESFAANEALAGRPGTAIVNDYRGIAVLSSFGMIKVPGLQWALLAEIDEQEALVPVHRILTKILILSTIIIIVYFILVFFIARQITKPLIRLRDAAFNLGEGRYNIEVPVYSHDEIGTLTESFNIMAKQIREKTTELQEERFGRMRSVIDGEEMERQRLSRELHDGIGQLLIAIKLRLESLLYMEGPEIKKSITELRNYFDNIIDEVRRISNNLMPSVLEAFGLKIAFRNLFSNTEELSGLDIHFESKGDFEDLDKKVKTYLYRMTQEAISNIVKHAEARDVWVSLVRSDDMLQLVIRDNGKGFATERSGREGGYGIHNMHERVALLNGNIKITSAIDKGTTITLQIPIITHHGSNQDFPRG